MDLRNLLSILFSISILLAINGVDANESSKQKEFKKHHHNNSAIVKTIETEDGDIYDCIDFYKQPAFDHPALKNHNFHPEMRPSFRSNSKHIPAAGHTDYGSKKSGFGLKDEACPFGTVPIRRLDDNHNQTRIKSAFMINNNNTSMISPRAITDIPGVDVAVSQTYSDGKVYHGVGANMTLHSPSLFDYEHTSGLIGVQNEHDSVYVGWTVNPKMYKDTKIRMFIYTDAGTSHCFNTDCPGFVLVRADIPLGSVLNAYSEPGGEFSYFSFFIYQDQANGCWWLEVGQDYTPIGFWPQRIFSGLATSGSYVACGGEAYHQPDIAGVANMGTGFRPSKKKGFNAYCLGYFVVDEAYNFRVADTKAYTSLPETYGVEDKIILSSAQNVDNGSNIHLDREHRVVYGGPQHVLPTKIQE